MELFEEIAFWNAAERDCTVGFKVIRAFTVWGGAIKHGTQGAVRSSLSLTGFLPNQSNLAEETGLVQAADGGGPRGTIKITL